MSADHLDLALLAGAAVLLVAIGGVRLSTRAGVPTLLLYLGLGMALGDDGIGIQFTDAKAARNIGLICLALIVAEGGLTTRWRTVRPVLPYAASLATVGVVTNAAVTAAVAHAVMDIDWKTAALLGAILSPTDAAAVFATLRQLRLPARLVGLLEAESGLNDAPVVIAVTLLSARHPSGLGTALLDVVYQCAAGAAIGGAVAFVAIRSLRQAALPAAGLYPLATIAFAIASYAGASSAHASGFLAVYLTALALGNARLPHHRATLGFAEGLAWLAQIGLFVMLGLLSTPSRVGPAIGPAIAIGAGLLLLARPVSVVLSTLGPGINWRDRLFGSVAGLRGAVPIVLATIPMTQALPHATRLFDVVLVLVVILTAVQSPMLTPLARRLRISASERGVELRVESAPLDEMAADLLTLRIPPRSKLHRVEIWELRLPATSSVTFIVRDGKGFVPDDDTTLLAGDDLLVIAARADREQVERRLRAVGRSGPLARFYGDEGDEGDGAAFQNVGPPP